MCVNFVSCKLVDVFYRSIRIWGLYFRFESSFIYVMLYVKFDASIVGFDVWIIKVVSYEKGEVIHLSNSPDVFC